MSDSDPTLADSWRHRLIVRYYRAPEHPARLRLIGWLRRLLHVSVLHIRIAPDVVMEIDARDFVERQILLHGGYELETLQLFRQLLAETSNFCDVGAHVGQYSLLAARTLQRRGRVAAFEPTPGTAARLLRNAALNKLCNLDVFICALGRADDFACMSTQDAASSGSAHLVTASATKSPVTHVAVATFSRLAPHLPPAGFDLVKVDTEGHEVHVLAGLFASSLPRPRHLLVEYNPHCFDYGCAGGLPAWLEVNGYDVRSVNGAPYAADRPLPNDNLWAVRRT